MSQKDFEFYVGGIEDTILTLLETEMKPLGVKTFASYSGELDSENLKQALGALTPKFPLVMVSYADGRDTQDPKTPAIFGRSLHYRHDCSFAVICASSDARGETARRRGQLNKGKRIGTYQMLAAVREILSGLNLIIDIDNEKTDLTNQPLLPIGIEYIARIPNVTAYAAIFDTYFRYSTPDRTQAGIDVTEFTLNVESLNDTEIEELQLPGVEVIDSSSRQ